MIDGCLWEQLIETNLPCLKIFEFFFTYSPHIVKNNLFLISIIRRYRTTFWINDKHWIVNCDYILTSSKITLYTIPIRTDNSEIIIKCDPMPLPYHYQLLSRNWSNHLQYVYTEKVSINIV
jgi:hypothetical protein